jgi:hypothetical protein
MRPDLVFQKFFIKALRSVKYAKTILVRCFLLVHSAENEIASKVQQVRGTWGARLKMHLFMCDERRENLF